MPALWPWLCWPTWPLGWEVKTLTDALAQPAEIRRRLAVLVQLSQQKWAPTVLTVLPMLGQVATLLGNPLLIRLLPADLQPPAQLVRLLQQCQAESPDSLSRRVPDLLEQVPDDQLQAAVAWCREVVLWVSDPEPG